MKVNQITVKNLNNRLDQPEEKFSELEAQSFKLIHSGKSKEKGWTWWLTPAIQALWEAEVGGSHEVGSSRPAWPTLRNPISSKNTKLTKPDGTCL